MSYLLGDMVCEESGCFQDWLYAEVIRRTWLRDPERRSAAFLLALGNMNGSPTCTQHT